MSVKERLEEAQGRYRNRPSYLGGDRAEELKEYSYMIERQIFSHLPIEPEDITDESILLFLPA